MLRKESEILLSFFSVLFFLSASIGRILSSSIILFSVFICKGFYLYPYFHIVKIKIVQWISVISKFEGGKNVMNKRVEGSYVSVTEAFNAVNRLRDEGYRRRNIFLVANEEVRGSIPYTMEAEVTTDEGLREIEQDDNRTLWEKIKDAFTFDEYDSSHYESPNYNADEDSLYEYRSDIAQGNILILLEEDDSRTSADSNLRDDVKASEPPLADDLSTTRNQIKGLSPELTPNDMRTDPSFSGDVPTDSELDVLAEAESDSDWDSDRNTPKETVNDVNVSLKEELELADKEKDKENYNTEPVTEGSILGSNGNSEVGDSMEEVTSQGTGNSGAILQRAETDDLTTAKSSDILPGQDGDSFQTEGLYAKNGTSPEEIEEENSEERER